MKPYAAVLLLLPSLALADWVELTGNYALNAKRSPQQQACRAVKALVAAQGALPGPDGRTLSATWEWEHGSGVAAENAAGIVGVGLAFSTRTAKGCGAEKALKRFVDDRVAAHERGDFLYDPDIEAMALAAKVTATPRYLEVAKKAFLARYAGGSGPEFVERWGLVHPKALVGFDAAMAIRAGLAVGERDIALDIADATVATMAKWVEQGNLGQLTASRGALLEALVLVDAKRYRAANKDLSDHLLLTQGTDGAWLSRNTQATAYAVLGLTAAGDEASLAASVRGRRWLHVSQLESGAWATFSDLAPEPFVGKVVHEVTAEALRAVAPL